MYLIGFSMDLDDHALGFDQDLTRFLSAFRLAAVIRTLRGNEGVFIVAYLGFKGFFEGFIWFNVIEKPKESF